MEFVSSQHFQTSFSCLFARKATVTERFYFHLFEQLPEVKPLFKGDFSQQRDMFEAMLARTIREIAAPGGIEGFGCVLSKTHSKLQLTGHQIETGGKALLSAIQDTIGDDLSSGELAEWERAISELFQTMKTASMKRAGSC